MQHQIQTFRAAATDEAVSLVHRALGQDAVVVEANDVASHRLPPSLFPQQEIEVQPQSASRSQTRKLSRTELVNQPKTARVVRSLAETMELENKLSQRKAPIEGGPSVAIDIEAKDNRQAEQRPMRDAAGHLDRSVACEKSTEREPMSSPTIPMEGDVASRMSQCAQRVPVASVVPDYQQSLKSLQTIVAQLERQSRPFNVSDVTGELSLAYSRLIEAEVDDAVARDLIDKLRRHTSPEVSRTSKSLMPVLTTLIEQEIRCAPPIWPTPGRRDIVTLIGPTGAGKTTTLAKLAGHFHLREGIRVGLVTVDTNRVGAREQLRTYAEILKTPFHFASTANELRIAIDSLDNVDLILIDTAGGNPHETPNLIELEEIVRITKSNHVMLVLSMTTSPRMFSRIARQFASARPTSLVVTKLDEMPGCGGLLSIAREVPYLVSYLTTGQEVPDQMEPAHPNRMARLILDHQLIFESRRRNTNSGDDAYSVASQQPAHLHGKRILS